MIEEEKKYTFTGKEKQQGNTLLRQIVALKDFGDVKEGQIGGWIEHEGNLSHEENCWVDCNAEVYGKASVKENAKVHGFAVVKGKAEVFDEAEVYGSSMVYGNARVYHKSKVFDFAEVTGNSDVGGTSLIYKNAYLSGDAEVKGENEELTRKVVTLDLPFYYITVTDTHVTVGYVNKNKEFWKNASYDEIRELCGKNIADLWCNKLKSFILPLRYF